MKSPCPLLIAPITKCRIYLSLSLSLLLAYCQFFFRFFFSLKMITILLIAYEFELLVSIAYPLACHSLVLSFPFSSL